MGISYASAYKKTMILVEMPGIEPGSEETLLQRFSEG